jgi:aromatic ring-opening dioxygenase catalytic subunit (LigB family)
MGKLTAAFGTSHAPGQTGFPESAPAEKREPIYRAWETLKKKFEEAKPDILVAISNDHMQNFHRVQPPFCVGTADTHVLPRPSSAQLLRLNSHPVQGHVAFAESLIQVAADHGLDLAYSEELEFMDEFAVPKHFLDPEDKVPLVPILTNCLNRHLPQPRRFYELGRAIAKTIAARPRNERVAVIGTGGLSHDPTGPNWCIIDEDFDRRFLDLLVAGEAESLLREFTLEKMLAAGPGGAPEVMNWLAPLGVVGPGIKATLVHYQAVGEWATGMGFLYWHIQN